MKATEHFFPVLVFVLHHLLEEKSVIGHFGVALSHCEANCETIHMKFYLQIKLIFISKAFHLASLWNRGKWQLGIEMAYCVYFLIYLQY